VVGLDWSIDIRNARNRIGDRAALQGNFDPTILYARPDVIRNEVKSILAKYGKGPGHIFNLGHGILPDVPVEHVKEFVKGIKEESIQYHQ
jgi:uroporphyrinogen decarboxylase